MRACVCLFSISVHMYISFFIYPISTTFVCVCVCVCLLLLTRYIQGAASPKDMLILVDAWVTTSWFIHYSQISFSFTRRKALMLTLTGLTPLGAVTLCSRLARCSCDTNKQKSSQYIGQLYHLQPSYLVLLFFPLKIEYCMFRKGFWM